METLISILQILVLLVIAYFTFTIVNIIVTILKCKKKDKTLRLCYTSQGRIILTLLSILYLVIFIGGIALAVYGAVNGILMIYSNALSVVAIYSIIFSYFCAGIVFVGKKQLLIGRLLVDYRKMRKVAFTDHNKMTFVYSQKTYSFSTRFVDKTELRKLIANG